MKGKAKSLLHWLARAKSHLQQPKQEMLSSTLKQARFRDSRPCYPGYVPVRGILLLHKQLQSLSTYSYDQ